MLTPMMLTPMDTVMLPPDLERFATEAITAGRYRDMAEVRPAGVDLLQRQDAARAELLASVTAARTEGDCAGYMSLADVEQEMQAVIAGATRQSG
jgi:putative addiction module CopG family antidote